MQINPTSPRKIRLVLVSFRESLLACRVLCCTKARRRHISALVACTTQEFIQQDGFWRRNTCIWLQLRFSERVALFAWLVSVVERQYERPKGARRMRSADITFEHCLIYAGHCCFCYRFYVFLYSQCANISPITRMPARGSLGSVKLVLRYANLLKSWEPRQLHKLGPRSPRRRHPRLRHQLQ
jgi:hypothetical protein